MKSKKIIALAKGGWDFCSYLFWPQWGRKIRWSGLKGLERGMVGFEVKDVGMNR